MVQSVELLLDDELDAQVRREWNFLAELSVPSQANHRSASNRPHVTIGVARSVTDDAEASLRSLDVGNAMQVRLGGLIVFGGKNIVLARSVVPSTPLLDLHRRVQDALTLSDGIPPHLTVGRYSPHVTLAMRLTPEQVAVGLRELTPNLTDLTGTVAALRRWDGDAKREWIIG